MALDREDTLKKAEKLLRQGRLEAAIAEYLRVVEDQPADWNAANMLGDLYVRAGQSDRAAVQYTRIAEHFAREGFYPKAAALYKKILKIAPEDEPALLRLADLSIRQGLLVDAKAYLNTVASRRRSRGDRRGASELVVRLGSVDPGDIDARLAAARAAEEIGDAAGAASRYHDLHADLLAKGRTDDALAALAEAARLNPADAGTQADALRAAPAPGDVDAHVEGQDASGDSAVLADLVEADLRSGRVGDARALLPPLLAADAAMRDRVIELAWTVAARNPEAAFVCIDAVVDDSIAKSDFVEAAVVLQEFVRRVPSQIDALLKLVEICVDGGLESQMYDAQEQLADAYLAAGHAAEARAIAEDLVAREPWERAHIERFRQALIMLKVRDPDSVIADRLGGRTPFTATDRFVDPTGSVNPATDTAADAVPAQPTVRDPQLGGSGPDELESGQNQEPADAATPSTAPLADNATLEAVFEDLRKQAVAPDASAEHMALARTYLEVGMEDEAVASLRAAARSPRQRFHAGLELARLYRERGDTPHLIEWLERTAQAAAPDPDSARAVLYDLGIALEGAGESARALAVFLELQADAGEYRDVSRRVDRLARAQTGG